MSPHCIFVVFTSVSLAVVVSGTADAQVTRSAEPGRVEFATSCPESARDDFNGAIALLHHMTYSDARARFSSIAAAHPTCAMAHWGVAMTLFQPLWPTRPTVADLQRGWREVLEAQRIGMATERERMFVAAAAAFFDPATTDYWQRIAKWAGATRELAELHPEDPETRAFFALSLLAAGPASGDTAYNSTAAAVLKTILRDRPAHPGAVHYTIHANDAAGREQESLDVVRSYADVAPRNPHALHMPTHIFVRLGEWQPAIDGNRRAADAALENPVGDARQWVWDEFPHAIEYLVYSLLQVGDDAAALQEMTRVRQTPDLQPSFKTAFHLASIPARYALERRDWAGAAELEPRPDPALSWELFPWPEAVTWFARGIGSARSGNFEGARAAEARLAVLRDASQRLGEDLFARQTEILRLGVAGWLASLSADPETAVRLLEEAIALETSTPKHPVTPAPTIPAAELLGDLLLEHDRPGDALAAYEASLRAAPNRFNSLAGAARAAQRTGNTTLATTYYRALREMAAAGSRRRELAEADAFLGRRPERP